MTDAKERKIQLDALSEPNTIVLVLDSAVESQVVMRYLKANAPKVIADGRALTTLNLMQLMAAQSVCAVFRNPENPGYTFFMDNVGTLRHRLRPDAELFDEMIITKPIKVGDYWDRPSATVLGTPNVPRFLEALQVTLSPFRLDYIDKGNDPPREMKMGSL